tara:strand:- start:659 stop:1645 length:987 start_codon:yes stop_codon:yes gene_type:complete
MKKVWIFCVAVVWSQGLVAASLFSKGHFWHFVNSHGHELRAASWAGSSDNNRDTTIVLLQGRASFIEKHQELIEDLVKRGYHVKTLDWLGQGGSSRLLSNPHKGHIDSFDQYLSDLHIFITDHVMPKAPGKIIFLASSMGGHLALRYIKEHPDLLDGAVVVSPMLDVVTSPYPRGLAGLLVGLISSMGGEKSYAFGYGDFSFKKETFENNKNTQSPERHARKVKIMKENPYHILGGPTFGWVHAAFESMEKTRDPSYIGSIKSPILLLTAGQDKVVRTEYDQIVCATLPKCVHKVYKNAYHNILNEIDQVRNAFLGDLEDFVHLVIEE